MKRYPHNPKCRCRKNKKAKEDWYINSPKYHNCFWVLIRHECRPHTLLEIANLLGLSISAITSIEKKALIKLRKRMKRFKIAHKAT
jgi:hypothetical protein